MASENLFPYCGVVFTITSPDLQYSVNAKRCMLNEVCSSAALLQCLQEAVMYLRVYLTQHKLSGKLLRLLEAQSFILRVWKYE